MIPEIRWVENDLKIEQLAVKMKILRKEYLEKNPNATNLQIENYINKKLKKESDSILFEQFDIINSAI